MQNYSRELVAQKKRREFIEHTRAHFEAKYSKLLTMLDGVRNIPVVYNFVRRMATRYQKNVHWGQVVPIEDVERIIDLQDSIVRIPCLCRTLNTGREARYCFGLGIDTVDILGKYPDYSTFEVMEKEEAKKLLNSFDEQGMVHSVWTFKTPYIGGLCNCDQDCVPYRVMVKYDMVQTMFRAEYVGQVDWDLCNGCKLCLEYCQFGALLYSNVVAKTTIEMTRCYGCGVCRAACPQEAITLRSRAEVPALPW